MKFVSRRRVGTMALIAAVALCVGGQAFAHIDGVGDVDGHLAHEDLTGFLVAERGHLERDPIDHPSLGVFHSSAFPPWTGV